MESTVTERVRELIEKSSLSVLGFSKTINIPSSTLSQQLNGRNGKNIGVQIDVITAILEAYPGLSAEWLLRGTGEMGRVENERQKKESLPSVDADSRLIESLNKQIMLLEKMNAMLEKRVIELEGEKELAADYGGVSMAAESVRYNKGE